MSTGKSWFSLIASVVVVSLIVTSIIMSFVAIDSSHETVEQKIDNTFQSGSSQTIDNVTVSGLMSSARITQRPDAPYTTDTSTIPTDFEVVGNLVLDETETGVTAIRPNSFSDPDQVIVTNGWCRARVSDLKVSEDEKSITITTNKNKLTTYVNQIFLRGEELITSGGQKGSTGPQGDKGPTGPLGEQGERGEQGEQGIPGVDGPAGQKGQPGQDGQNGQDGDVGPQGDQGEKGEKGPTGSPIDITVVFATVAELEAATVFPPAGEYAVVQGTGELYRSFGTYYVFAVDLSIDGVKGQPGPQGEDGDAGPDGQKGEPGSHGQNGQQGDQGQPGSDGPKGPPGDAGVRGETGDQGGQGATGNQGQKGDAGVLDVNLFGNAARIELNVDTLTVDSVQLTAFSEVWDFTSIPVWVIQNAVTVPTWQDIFTNGEITVLPVNDRDLNAGTDIEGVTGPIYIAYNDGVSREVLGPFLSGAAQVINFPEQSDQEFVANTAFAVDPIATSDSTLPITYTSLTPTVASISGTTITMHTQGVAVIRATQDGDVVNSAASPKTQNIELYTV